MSRVRQTQQQTKGSQLNKDWKPKSAGDSRNKKAKPAK